MATVRTRTASRAGSPAPGSATPPRVRQGRGVRTEEAIIEATLTLLAARGVHGTSLDMVAETVGVAKSSILWHFGSKEELLLRVAERVLEQVARGPVQEILALPTIEARAEATWRFFSETLKQRPALRRVLLYLIVETVEQRPELRTRLQQLYRDIRAMWEAGLRSAIADPGKRRRLAVISIAALDGIFLQWLIDPDAIDLESLHGELRELSEQARRGRTRRDGS